MNVKQKILELISAINAAENEFKKDDIEAVENAIYDAAKYIDRVIAMESAMVSARFRMEPDEYREFILNLDRGRKIAHDALIASIRLVNRLCGIYGIEKIYAGPMERIAIAEFGKEIVDSFFAERKL
ncbi:MAG: DUF3232 domain-containing protein [Gammaproteobacteria bacterium]|nr:DUF3232 domain-containing protein [Gammaproteobacteria bacterium]